jgi:ferredoxin-type protein NapH
MSVNQVGDRGRASIRTAGLKRPPRRSRRWGRWRRITQLAIALFYLGLPVVWLYREPPVAGTLAALHIGPVDLVEPAAGISAALAAGTIGLTLLLGMLPVLLLAAVAGPVYCSWVCPYGALSEIVDRYRYRGRRRWWGNDSWTRVRRVRGWSLGLVLLAGVVVGVPLAALVSPPRLLTSLPLEVLLLGSVPVVTATFLVALAAFEVFGPRRLWCRALCPVGALANFVRTRRTLTIGYNRATCECPNIAACHLSCPWGIDPRQMRRFDGCTSCLTCVDACPSGSLAPSLGRREGVYDKVAAPPPAPVTSPSAALEQQ